MHHRRPRKGHPPRLPGWDYSRLAAYFVTFQVRGRTACLSRISDGRVRLLEAGRIVEQCGRELATVLPMRLDSMVIMPDHVHAIVVLTGGALIHQGPHQLLLNAEGALMNSEGALMNQGPTGSALERAERAEGLQERGMGRLVPMMSDPRLLLGKVVRAWKAKSCRLIRSSVRPSFAWQSRYYERIIRTPRALDRIRRYIAQNPVVFGSGRTHPRR